MDLGFTILLTLSVVVVGGLVLEVRAIEAHLNATASNLQVSYARVITPWGSRVVELLRALRARVQSQAWALESREVESFGIDFGEMGRAQSREEGEENASGRLFRTLLENLSKSFGAECSAIMYSRRESSGERSSTLVTRNSKGRRFEKALTQFLEEERDRLDAPVVRDSFLSDSPLSSLALFGIRYSLRFPFSQITDTESFTGFFWLGYSHERPPLDCELERGRIVAQRISDDMRSARQIASLTEECKKAEVESEQKGSVMTQVSHDVRTPLSNLQAILSLLSRETFSTEIQEMVRIALRSCQSATEVLDEMVDFARLSVGKLEAHPQEVDLSSLLRDIVLEFRVAADLKGVPIVLDLSDSRFTIMIDPGHARRSLSNVVGNAIKYTHRGSITISLVAEVGTILVRVVDTGVGMSEDDVGKLFRPFERMKSSQGVSGYGLGLFITKALMELNHGEIHIASQEAHGTTVNLRFRAVVPSEPMEAKFVRSIVDTPRIRDQRGTISVLIVDDDVECGASLARALTRCGYKTFTAYQVNEALGIVNFSHPEIVITDASMPEGGGERIIEYLQTSGSRSRGVVLTGDASLASASMSSSWKARGILVLTKPVPLGELIGFMDGTIERRSAD